MPNFLPRLNQLAASIALAAGGVALMPTAQAAAPAAGSNMRLQIFLCKPLKAA